MANYILNAFSIVNSIGWENARLRIFYLLKRHSGYLAWKTSAAAYQAKFYQNSFEEFYPTELDEWLVKSHRFFPRVSANNLKSLISDQTWESQVTSTCEAAVRGDYPFFSNWTGSLGWPPEFNCDPVSQASWPRANHWTQANCSISPSPDIKLGWEASRLSLVFYLVRQYNYSQDDKWAEYVWQLIDSWIEQNPVNQTIAWSCGQEVSLRLMAILWGLFHTLGSAAITPERLSAVHLLIWQSGKRIYATTEYAISQKNNHSLSEATILWTIGLLFPEFKEAKNWRLKGKAILSREVDRQVYADGSYVQHSFNYHRVMLDDLMWAIRIGELNNSRLPDLIYQKFTVATQWLRQLVDEQTGGVPNYGANDGANILPLSCTDYCDFRPTIRAAEAIAGISSPPTLEGKLNEKSLWLNNSQPVERELKKPTTWSAPIGGYYAFRTRNSQLMVRCANLRDRPSHADMLHIDLWHQGKNILRDSGSYFYQHNDPQLKSYFPSVAAHNTVRVEDYEQMTKGPSFLWMDWPLVTHSLTSEDESTRFDCTAQYRGKKQNYQHHRSITQSSDSFIITDAIDTKKNFCVHWHLSPEITWKEKKAGQWTGLLGEKLYLAIEVEGLYRAEWTTSWESLYYGTRRQRPLLKIHSSGEPVTTTFHLSQ
ncbi:heparinase II/III family protein [bacterium]|nr:heparinase II/III family protein [bacterium]